MDLVGDGRDLVVGQAPHEISLLDFACLLWRRKVLIFAITSLVAVSAAAFSLTITPMYKAKVLMVPTAAPGTGGQSVLSGQLGGLASFAGIGGGDGGAVVEKNLATLGSRAFLERFVRENKSISRFFLIGGAGNKKNSEVNDESAIYDSYLSLKEATEVERGQSKVLLTFSVIWTEPVQAAELANAMVANVNEYLRGQAIAESTESIKLLKEQIAVATDVEIKALIYRLIEKELQNLMLAEVRKQFAFSIIDPAVPPKQRHSPQRLLMVISAALSGFFIAVLGVLIRDNVIMSRARA